MLAESLSVLGVAILITVVSIYFWLSNSVQKSPQQLEEEAKARALVVNKAKVNTQISKEPDAFAFQHCIPGWTDGKTQAILCNTVDNCKQHFKDNKRPKWGECGKEYFYTR
jgi:hypothetical protein